MTTKTAAATESWREEKRSAWLYRVLAEVEDDPPRARLFEQLAVAAEEQADTWTGILAREGAAPPAFAPDARLRVVAVLARWLGPRRMLPALAATKVRGLSSYSSALPEGHPFPLVLGDFGQRHRRVTRGGSLRAAVFGVNDGLVSNASLVMGVAGAGQSPQVVLLTGIAGMAAGALSMAAGEYVSVRSQRELFEHQIGLERDELREYPEAEAEELALIYAARGVPIDRARRLASDLLRNPEQALDVLSREELGLNPDDLGSPIGAALTSFVAFTLGAFVPVLPFLIGAGGPAVLASALLTGAGLFGVGATLTLFTGRRALASGLRMLLIGGAAGLATWLLGRALGVALA